jgi:hypothetical protein
LSSPNPASSKARAQFKKGVDYIVENVDPQIGGTTKSMVYAGVKTAIEYHLSLDMAKHLALMEIIHAATNIAVA